MSVSRGRVRVLHDVASWCARSPLIDSRAPVRRQAQGTGCGDEPPRCRRSAAEHAAAGATSTLSRRSGAASARAFDV